MRKRLALILMVTACGGGDDTPAIDAASAVDGSTTIDARSGADAAAASDDAALTVFDASGTVVGPSAAAGPVIVGWVVSATSPDYVYKFGDGVCTDGATFTAGLVSDPPEAARNRMGTMDFGVGVLVLLEPGTSLPEGIVTEFPVDIGVSARHAIIYRGAEDDGTVVPWTAAFPVGLSCGVCVDSTTGFDSYEPIDCASLVIDTDPEADFCNWT